jgi:hypothetical protein
VGENPSPKDFHPLATVERVFPFPSVNRGKSANIGVMFRRNVAYFGLFADDFPEIPQKN